MSVYHNKTLADILKTQIKRRFCRHAATERAHQRYHLSGCTWRIGTSGRISVQVNLLPFHQRVFYLLITTRNTNSTTLTHEWKLILLFSGFNRYFVNKDSLSVSKFPLSTGLHKNTSKINLRNPVMEIIVAY